MHLFNKTSWRLTSCLNLKLTCVLISYLPYTYSLKEISCIVYNNLVCETKFHLWNHVNFQKVLKFEAFWVFRLERFSSISFDPGVLTFVTDGKEVRGL